MRTKKNWGKKKIQDVSAPQNSVLPDTLHRSMETKDILAGVARRKVHIYFLPLF